jgi:hypothetical protein
MKSELVIAVRCDDAELVAVHLKAVLGMSFAAHDSGYKGDYWRHATSDGGAIEVSYNDDPMWLPGDPDEEQFFQPKFAEFGTLVSVYGSEALAASVLGAVNAGYSDSVVVKG